jgi:predicted MFS family arabinose efflux permease
MAAFLVLPLYVGAAAQDLGLDQQQIGFLASAVAGGSAISSVGMMLLVRKIRWRRAGAVTLSLLLVPMLCSVFIDDARWFVALQGLAALGSGSTYSLALTALADRRHPDRAFGYSVAAQVSFQVVGMLTLPHLVARAGIDGILVLFVCMALAGLLLLRWFPGQGRELAGVDHKPSLINLPMLLALGGCFFFFFNVGAVWTYIERMAVLAGLSATQIGNSLALGVAVGIPAALLASWCGDRFGRIGPLSLGALGTLVALVLLDTEMSLTVYVLAAALYNFVWNFSLPFQYAVVNAVDAGGSGVAAAPAFHGAGVAVGPGLAAMYVTETSLAAVNWVAGIGVVLSLMLFVVALVMAGGTTRNQGATDG